MKVTILHLADLHISKPRISKINNRIKKLFDDLDKLKKEFSIHPDIILFVGDLINKGKESQDEYELAVDHFISPLLSHLNLDTDRFFMVPGNHEIDRTKISETFEQGLKEKLVNSEAFSDYYHDLNNNEEEFNSIKRRLESYFEFKDTIQNSSIIKEGFFCDAYKIKFSNINIGILGLNSVWRSSQFGNDTRRIIIGEDVFSETIEYIKDCDLKIALTHHPFEMMADWEEKSLRLSMAKELDLLVTGHIHDSDFSYVKPILGGLYVSTCGSLYSGRIKEGYSIVQIDLLNKKLSVYLRTWYSRRTEFDQETEKCENGLVEFCNFECDNSAINELITIISIKNKLNEENLPANIIYPFEGISELSLQDVFVDPLLGDRSNFDKAHRKDAQYFKINELLDKDRNLIFFAKKEYGKTSLLKYIQSLVLNDFNICESKIPVLINFSQIPKNKHAALKRTIKVELGGHCDKNTIENYLTNGNFIILVDDYDDYSTPDRGNRKNTFLKFYNTYPNCRYILTMNENLSQAFKQESGRLNADLDADSYYLYSFNTARVRKLLEKWCHYRNFDVDKILKQIMFYFHQLQIPVTPMAVTLFIGVLIRDRSSRNIYNEAYLIENYIESRLEKLDPSDVTSEMDFRDKESFFAHIAFKMAEKNKFEWSRNEFEREKLDHFENFDEDLPSEKMFEDFFEKGFFQVSSNMISFKFRFLFNFFLAKAMQKDQTKMEYILSRDDYLKFDSALAYKAGLDRNDIKLLEEIDNRAHGQLKEFFEKHREKDLNQLKIEAGLIQYADNIEKDIREKNTADFKDELKDRKYLSYDEEDQEMEEEVDYDDIVRLITLNSDIIRNTREIDPESKRKYLENNVNCYFTLLWQTMELFEDIIDSTDKNGLKEFLLKEYGKVKEDKEIELMLKRVKQIIFQIIPVSILVYMSERLYNLKLKRPVSKILKEEGILAKKLFFSLLLLNLDLQSALKELKKIVKESKSYVVDNIIFLYVMFYCYENKLEDPELDELIKFMNSIRDKHADPTKKVPPFVRDTFASDVKREVLIRQKK